MTKDISLRNLETARGSVTNATVIESHGDELLFSYTTLVGVRTYRPEGERVYISRNPYRGGMSNMTARQISNWLGQKRSEAVKSGRAIEVEQSVLEEMVTFKVEVKDNGKAE